MFKHLKLQLLRQSRILIRMCITFYSLRYAVVTLLAQFNCRFIIHSPYSLLHLLSPVYLLICQVTIQSFATTCSCPATLYEFLCRPTFYFHHCVRVGFYSFALHRLHAAASCCTPACITSQTYFYTVVATLHQATFAPHFTDCCRLVFDEQFLHLPVIQFLCRHV